MTSELTREELIELFNNMTPKSLERMAEIDEELSIRVAEIEAISERIARGGVRTIEEVDSLTKEVENHMARANQLKHEADLLIADFLMDANAIFKSNET